MNQPKRQHDFDDLSNSEIEVREARASDNYDLQRLQECCPQGTKLVLSTVNTPDFFARVKSYAEHKVYVARKRSRIIGSAACAVRDGIIDGTVRRIGYEFQYFTDPAHRRQNVAHILHRRIENYFSTTYVDLSYGLVMADNTPSLRMLETVGYSPTRTLLMPGLAVRKSLAIAAEGTLRSMQPDDLPQIAQLLNSTWRNYSFYQTHSPASVADYIERIPELGYDNIHVYEKKGNIVACVGAWDWRNVMKVSVNALDLRLRIIGWLLSATKIVPKFPKQGDVLDQMMLTLVGYETPADFGALLRYVNNIAFANGIEQIFCICNPKDDLLEGLKGFVRIDNKIYLYTKIFSPTLAIPPGPIYVDGIDA